MKKLLCVLTIALLLYSFETNFAKSNDKNIVLTQKQKNFAKKMTNETVFLKAEWINTYELDITMEPHYSGLTTKLQAENFANIYSVQGYLYTEKNICVKIVDALQGELAYECIGDQSES